MEEIDINHLLQTRKPVQEEAKVQAVFKSYPDQEQYVSKAEVKEFIDHTDSIKLDPGGILTPTERVEIEKLCQEYKDVIRPEPGLYNGHFGHIDSYKSLWYPCEGEGFATKTVLQHYKPYIRESNHTTVLFTDNQPVVDAWKVARKGAFSSNARLATFLVAVVNFPIEIHHKAGAQMLTSDYISRHPQVCTDKQCALCVFAYEGKKIGDNCADIREITVEEVTKGKVNMPLTGWRAWLDIQHDDIVHVRLRDLIACGTVPPARKTKGDHNKLKLLHNLYKKGDLKVDNEGMVLVKQIVKGATNWVISVPYKLFPGLCTALHLKFNHPSKGQLTSLMSRYFYSPGGSAVISQISEQCSQCLSMKILPKTLKEHIASQVVVLGANFATDIMMHQQQKFLVTVENVSGYTWVDELPDQTAASIKDKLLAQILPFTPEEGATIRSDGASSFQTLQQEAAQSSGMWAKHNIKFEIGERFNVNKNPQAENKISEVQKEFLRHCPSGSRLSPVQLCEVTKTLNARIRANGLASREILLSRSIINNKLIDLQARDLSKEKFDQRKLKNSKVTDQKLKSGMLSNPNTTLKEGDLVFIRGELSKHHPRDQFIIQKVIPESGYALIRKSQSQFQAKKYKIDLSQLILTSSFRPGPQISGHKNTELSINDSSNEDNKYR